MASGIYFSGLSSGLDTSSIVSKLTELARAPITRLQTQKSNLTTQKNTFDKIKSLIASLELKAKALDTPDEFGAYTATSADATIVRVAAGSGAAAGTFAVAVHHLAAAQRTYSDAFESKTATGLFGTGTLKLTAGTGTPVDITVDGSTTLESLATAINTQVAGANAAVVFDGTKYRLQVSSEASGLAHAITFDDTGLTMGLSKPANTIQAAQDLEMDIDGIAITRSTNIVNDALAGVTLDLRGTSESDGLGGYKSTLVNVSVDQSGIVKKVQEFVDSYNAVMNELGKQTTTSTTYDPSRLVGDLTLRTLQRDIQGSMTNTVQGLAESPTSLAQVGITTLANGTLSVDSGKLTTALGNNMEAVQRLFISDKSLGSTAVSDRVSSMADRYTDSIDGRLTLRIQGLSKRISSAASDVTKLEDRLTKYEKQLQAQFNSLETLMSSLQTQSSYLTQYLNASTKGS